MTILFVATRAFTLNRGGIERFSIELGKRFLKDGHKVLFLSSINDLSPEEADNLGLDVPHYYFPIIQKIRSRQNFKYLCDLVETNQVDILFNQQADNLQWIKLCHDVRQKKNVKVVTILHFDPYHYSNLFRASRNQILSAGLSLRKKAGLLIRNTRLYRFRQKHLFGRVFTSAVNHSDAFVVLSQNARPRLMDMMGTVDSHKVSVISNPVTVDYIEQGKPFKKKQLLFVGRMEFEAKRPDLMLLIWERLHLEFPDWELILLGDGDYLPVVRNIASQYNLERIKFMGCSNSAQYYQSASILCVTSNTEGFSLVTVEASQNYVVPIAFDSFTAVTDVIRDGITGYIIPPFDIDSYASRLRHLMSNPGVLNEMAEAAHEYVQIFNMDRIAPRWYELFESITHKS